MQRYLSWAEARYMYQNKYQRLDTTLNCEADLVDEIVFDVRKSPMPMDILFLLIGRFE
jgi:hypothetical protein